MGRGMGDDETKGGISPVPHLQGDLAEDPTRPDDPVNRTDPGDTVSGDRPSGGEPGGNPGDEASPGTPGTGENVCPVCAGKGVLDGAPCEECGGSGKVIEEIGGA